MHAYLHATGRGAVAQAADAAAAQGFLSADEGSEYDEVIEIVRKQQRPSATAEFLSELVRNRTNDQWTVHA